MFGPNRVNLLNKLGIFTVKDLITYYPREHEDRSIPKNISELQDGEEALIEAIVVSKMSEIKLSYNKKMYKLIVRDEFGTCQITWFNQSYLKNKFKFGEKYKFFGKVKNKFGKIDIISPVFDEEATNRNTRKNNTNISINI